MDLSENVPIGVFTTFDLLKKKVEERKKDSSIFCRQIGRSMGDDTKVLD